MIAAMAKKHTSRTDAERRARQCERLSRVLRVLRFIMGPGRWDAEALARELEVSPRTIHRILQTLSMAEVPWFFSKEDACYRVREGFVFPSLNADRSVDGGSPKMLGAVRQLHSDTKRFLLSLEKFLASTKQG